MTALERLIANCNAVIGFLKTFSSNVADDVVFEWIKDDDSTEIITFSNIKKFQESVNVFRDSAGNFVDSAGAPIDIDAQTLNGKTALELSTSNAIKFKMLLDTSAGCFPERWMWGVTENNELIHWGRSIHGVAGDIGLTDNNAGYSLIAPPHEKRSVLIRNIFATPWSGFVLYDDGSLYAIGYSGYGNTGQGNTATQTKLVKVLDNVESFASSSHGYYVNQCTYLAIKTDGSVWTWGDNTNGQCANGNTTVQLSAAERVIDGLETNEKVISGYVCDSRTISTFVLTNLGRVFAAGWNGDGGALGLGDTVTRNRFELVSGMLADKNVVELSVAGGMRVANGHYARHSVCALTDTGELFVWGYGGGNDLGLGNTTSYDMPQLLTIEAATGKFIKICSSLGSETSRFAITDSGEMWAWGTSRFGCLGVAESTLTEPVKVTLINADGTTNESGIKDALIITSTVYSYHHTCFVFTNDNRIFSAGHGTEGQTATNTKANSSVFTEIPFAQASFIKQMSFGGHSSACSVYALLSDGRIASWGDNAYRQSVISRADEAVCVPQFTIQ